MSCQAELSNLPAFFSEIEDAFCARRNAPLLLSPLDFEKVAEWHSAKIPVEVIKDGIFRYFEKLDRRKTPMRRAICISFAEGCVLKALEEFRRARVGAQCGAGAAPQSDKTRKDKFLGHLSDKLDVFLADESLTSASPKSAALVSALRGIICELRSDEKASIVDAEAKLSPLDSELGKLLLSETPGEISEKWRSESREKLRKAGMAADDAIADAAEKNILTNMAFRRAGIPRLSILYYDE